MPEEDPVPTINDQLEIPDAELAFRYSRSSGPGGQNVNKVATKVTLLFDVRSSPSLGDEDRRRIQERLANRISRDGVLHLTSQRHRTRAANRRDVVERFGRLLADALQERPERRPSGVPRREQRRRLRAKQRRGRLKELRSRPSPDDD